MSKPSLLSGALLAGAVAILPAAGAAWVQPPVQEVLKEKDQQKIGRAISKYLEARDEEEGITEAQEDLQDELTKLGKKHGDDPLQAALSMSADLGKGLYFATDYNKTSRKVKSGSVTAFEISADYLSGPDGKTPTIGYAVWAPAKYKPKTGPYPVILAIPGLASGGKPQRAEDHLIEYWKDNDLRGGAIVIAFDMPADLEAWGGMSGGEGLPGGIPTILLTFKEVRETYAIDFDRVFLAGRGPGVDAALSVASMYPHLFAGVIGRAGDPQDRDVTNLRNLPAYFTGAGAGATAVQEKLVAMGSEGCTIHPEGTEADVWAWMQETPRAGNPIHVSLRPGAPIPNKAYWLEVPPGQGTEDTLVEAVIDRESNTVTVTGSGVDSVTLYFNDQLLDLSKPVRVVCNGMESEHQIVRNLATALKLIYRGQNDPGRFYVAERRFDLPQGTQDGG